MKIKEVAVLGLFDKKVDNFLDSMFDMNKDWYLSSFEETMKYDFLNNFEDSDSDIDDVFDDFD